MKSISLRKLHERTGAWVRKAVKLGAIIVTEPGNPLVRLVAVSDARPVKPYRVRRLRPGYAGFRGKLGRGTNTTAIISEHRERAARS